MIWFSRFERYRLMGASRSIEAVWQSEPKPNKAPRPNPHWYKIVEVWQWKQRAEAYDLAEIARIDAEEQEARDAERKEWQQRRRQMAQAAFGKVAEALKAVDTQGQSLRQVVGSMATVLEELRAEFDDLPTHRAEFTKPIEINGVIALTAGQELDEWRKQQSDKVLNMLNA